MARRPTNWPSGSSEEQPKLEWREYGFQEFSELLNYAQDKGLVRIQADEERGLIVYLGAEFHPPAPPPEPEPVCRYEEEDEPQPLVPGQPTATGEIPIPEPPPKPQRRPRAPRKTRVTEPEEAQHRHEQAAQEAANQLTYNRQAVTREPRSSPVRAQSLRRSEGFARAGRPSAGAAQQRKGPGQQQMILECSAREAHTFKPVSADMRRQTSRSRGVGIIVRAAALLRGPAHYLQSGA